MFSKRMIGSLRPSGLALVISLSFAMPFSIPSFAQDYLIEVNGIVCEFCAFGVSKKVSKLPFIDRSKFKRGVLVEIESQLVTIAVKPDATLDKDQLYAAIEAGGYNPVDIWRLNEAGERLPYRP